MFTVKPNDAAPGATIERMRRGQGMATRIFHPEFLRPVRDIQAAA